MTVPAGPFPFAAFGWSPSVIADTIEELDGGEECGPVDGVFADGGDGRRDGPASAFCDPDGDAADTGGDEEEDDGSDIDGEGSGRRESTVMFRRIREGSIAVTGREWADRRATTWRRDVARPLILVGTNNSRDAARWMLMNEM